MKVVCAGIDYGVKKDVNLAIVVCVMLWVTVLPPAVLKKETQERSKTDVSLLVCGRTKPNTSTKATLMPLL